jgi:hypothetical protein
MECQLCVGLRKGQDARSAPCESNRDLSGVIFDRLTMSASSFASALLYNVSEKFPLCEIAVRKLAERAFVSLNGWRRFRQNPGSVAVAPSPQAAVDLGGLWHSVFPDNSGVVTGGYAEAFNDTRANWAIERLGGVSGLEILELGPLEGGHTYMLDRAGAKSVIAVEALKSGYLKCLIAKEVLDIKSAHFLLGNFIPWLEIERRRFDVIWASGVLYHMTEPLRLLELVSKRTDRLYLWTHFYCDDDVPSYLKVRRVSFFGETISQFERPYFMLRKHNFCGGVCSGRAWLRRSDLLKALEILGFKRIEVGFEDLASPLGPSFAVIAQKT